MSTEERMERPSIVAVYIADVGPSLDPITLYFHDIAKGRGRVVLESFCSAWSCYFGAIGEKDIASFFKEAPLDYMTGKLSRIKESKAERKRLTRMVYIAQEYLKSLQL